MFEERGVLLRGTTDWLQIGGGLTRPFKRDGAAKGDNPWLKAITARHIFVQLMGMFRGEKI